MKFIRFYGSNGYSGCDYTEYQIFDDDITEGELNEISAELALANAESFEYIAAGGWGEEFDSDEELNNYYNDAFDYCGWEQISAEEYDENTLN